MHIIMLLLASLYFRLRFAVLHRNIRAIVYGVYYPNGLCVAFVSTISLFV